MKRPITKTIALVLLAGSMLAGSTLVGGCARPWELGYTPAYSTTERGQMIARNWDYEGKQTQDDIDSALLLRPTGHLTTWNLR